MTEWTARKARITWSAELERQGLPNFTESIDPCWFADSEEGWSLKCQFDPPPRVQGNPSFATVQFWMDAAPHHRLVPGIRVKLFERTTFQHAVVEILE